MHSPHTAPVPRPWLVGDIGGTNARFGWIDDGDLAVSHVATLPVADHAGPAAAARGYLDGLQQALGAAYRAPQAAALAVATAVGGERVEFTNSDWSFSRAALARSLGVSVLRVLNDFEALAYSLPGLQPSQWRTVGPAVAAEAAATPAGGALAVVGPGTGLGVAGLVPAGDGWVAVPGEGGHATLAAGDDAEAELLAIVRRRHAHVSAERLLSGIGLPVLHAALAEQLGRAAPERSAREIVAHALAGDDELAVRTVDLFCALLGGFAGNVALTLGACGGLFVGGGIVPRLGGRFDASRFRERFEAKGRFAGYLAAIPTRVITDTLAALSGAASTLGPLRR